MIVWKVIEKTCKSYVSSLHEGKPSSGQTVYTQASICNCPAINTRAELLEISG